MAQENKISSEISAIMLAEIIEKINGISSSMSGVLLFNLTGEERQGLRTMGDKSLAFVRNSLDYADANPTLVPAYLDLPEAKKDFALTGDLLNILQRVNTLQRAIEDTMMVAGSEAFDAASVFYNSVKGASRVNVPGSEAVYNDLQKRYPGHSKKAAPKE
jgi:hypothetical protein